MEKTKVTTFLLLAAFILSTLAAINFYLDRNKEQARRIWVEDQLQKITTAKEALEKEKEELVSAKQALESQVSDLSNQAKNLSEQIAQEKRAREGLTAELAQANRESTDVKGRLETERKEKLSLTEELAKAKQSYQALSNELATLRQAKEALEKRVKEMLSTQASEAEKIVVKPQPAAAAPKVPEGKVLVVNREFNFVVVNLGSKDGIQTGTKLAVLRGEKTIGTTQVERLYENMSAATVLVEEQKGQIQEGDLVRVAS